MPPRVVMVIRHAEKPQAGTLGIRDDGTPDKKSLTPRGWQRAGALAVLFGDPSPRRPFSQPTHIFAAGPDDEDPSQRPRETIAPLATKLGLPIQDRYNKGQLSAAFADIVALDDTATVLVSWEHKTLAKYLARGALAPGITITDPVPETWPDDRFDVVWVFERTSSTTYRFKSEPELLLANDAATVF